MTKQEQISELLQRGVEEIINKATLEKKLKSGKNLRVKLGIDPTSPNIHIGRAVVLWKLRAFQELGHKAVFIVGDYTAQIGDTSDKEAERPVLTEAQVKKNMKDYFKQAFLILDKAKTEVHYNSEWLKKVGMWDIVQLSDLFSLNEFQSRELIKRRVSQGKRVSMRETIYPIMQGYDSVAVKADVELGGTDQRFNLLAGRTIQPVYHQDSQDILITKLLEGTDGRKMSSSWGNVINLTDTPKDMFGKVMSIHDNLIEKYFELATKVPSKEIQKILSQRKHPRDQKLTLAWEITNLYHGMQNADLARKNFIAQFSEGQLPENIPSKKLKAGSYQLSKLIVASGFASSGSEAKRLIQQGGVKLNGTVKKDDKKLFEFSSGDEVLLQVGKRKFVKLIS